MRKCRIGGKQIGGAEDPEKRGRKKKKRRKAEGEEGRRKKKRKKSEGRILEGKKKKIQTRFFVEWFSFFNDSWKHW